MNAVPDEPYVLIDTRQDGYPREVARFREPREALAARDALRRAGDVSADVAIANAVDPITSAETTYPPSAGAAPAPCPLR